VTDDHTSQVQEIIEACRLLIKTLGDSNRLPLEREAGYLLARALHLQVEKLGLLEAPELQEFLSLELFSRPPRPIRRFPQDFPDLSPPNDSPPEQH